MIIERSGLRLIRLTEEYIELVRQKRNLPEIQLRMEYREYITPEMQREWFKKIDNVNNNYFIIEKNSKLIGMINGANSEWDKGITNNGGIFIWDNEYLESVEVLQASLLLTDLGYYFGIQRNYIRILKDNARAIAFNKAIGYRLVSGQEQNYNQLYELTPDSYFIATEKIRSQFGLNEVIKVFVKKDEYLQYAAYKETAHEYLNIIPVDFIFV